MLAVPSGPWADAGSARPTSAAWHASDGRTASSNALPALTETAANGSAQQRRNSTAAAMPQMRVLAAPAGASLQKGSAGATSSSSNSSNGGSNSTAASSSNGSRAPGMFARAAAATGAHSHGGNAAATQPQAPGTSGFAAAKPAAAQPGSDVATLAPPEPVDLSGLWGRDAARSDAAGFERALDVLRLSGLQRVTARLIEGMQVVGRSGGQWLCGGSLGRYTAGAIATCLLVYVWFLAARGMHAGLQVP
jgi:hypothetical protein